MLHIELDINLESLSKANVVASAADADAADLRNMANHLLSAAKFMEETDNLGD